MYESDQFQIGATASCVPVESPPPFLANFAEVAVDRETGRIQLIHYVAAVDCGVAINPKMAEGQMEGAIVNGIGYALTEEMQLSSRGRGAQSVVVRLQDPLCARSSAPGCDTRRLV